MRIRVNIPLALAASFALALSAACQSTQTLTPSGGTSDTIPVDLVAYRPDGSLVLFTEPAIHVFDGTLTSELNAISLAFPTTPSYAMPYKLRFSLSSDGATAAVAYSSFSDMTASTIEILAIPGGELLKRFDFPDTYSIGTPALSPDGKLLYAVVKAMTPASPGGTRLQEVPTMLDATTGETTWTDSTEALRRLPVWSPDGATLFTVEMKQARKLDALDARTGALKWQTDLDTRPDTNSDAVRGLALTGNGASLAGAAQPPAFSPCNDAGDCSFFPYWSTGDGTPHGRLPYVPDTGIYESTVDGMGAFACDTIDTCVVGLRDFSLPNQPLHLRVYKSDGTVLRNLPADGATPSVAFSPDGQFVATAAEFDTRGGAKVFSVATGNVIGQVSFLLENF